jgi:hypothetical protein
MKAQVIANSGQLPGESWIDFAARREEQNQLRAQKEDDKARQSRLQREAAQSRFPNPGKKGPVCFHWELIDGFQVRTPLSQAEAQDIWSSVPDSHKRYDSFRNEWDINDAFDPEGKGRAEDDKFNDLYDDDISGNAVLDVGHTACDNVSDIIPDVGQQPVRDNLGDIVPDVGQQATHDNLGDIVPDILDVGQQAASNILDASPTTTGKIVSSGSQQAVARDSTCDTESLDQVLPFQYGFVLPDNFDDLPIESLTLPWDKVRTIVGDMESPLDERYKLPVTVFLGCFLHLSLSQMLPTLQHIWDLHERCPMTIHDQAPNVPMSFKVVNCSDGHQCYRLNQSETSPWDLVLEQAVDVLECQQRLWGPDINTIVEAFLARGIPFRTLSSLLPEDVPRPLDNDPIDHELAADYTLSEQRRRELLHGP